MESGQVHSGDSSCKVPAALRGQSHAAGHTGSSSGSVWEREGPADSVGSTLRQGRDFQPASRVPHAS